MKMFIHRTLRLFPVVGLLIILSGCFGNLSYQDALSKNRKSIDDSKLLHDAEFLVEAQSLNLLEMKMNELAAEKGYSSELVNYAKKAVEHDKDMAKQIKKLSRKEKFKIPSELKVEHDEMLRELASSARADFDGNYIKTLRTVNSENSDLYYNQSTDAHDNDVRAFAARRLGDFKTQADRLAEVGDQLIHTQN